MEPKDRERRIAEVRARLAKLAPADQQKAIDGFAEVLTLLEMPRKPGEAVSLLISLDHGENIEYPSG
jgi:hypothetical protein